MSVNCEWLACREHLRTLQDYLEDGWVAPTPNMLGWTAELLDSLRERRLPVPHDIFPMPDGNVCVSWHLVNDKLVYIEVEGSGQGEVMVTHPPYLTKHTRFFTLTWCVK